MSNLTRIAMLAALLVVAVSLAVRGEPAQARGLAPSTVIEVHPGSGAIKKALRTAKAGDTLNLHAGTYNETVNIRKNSITLQSAGDGNVIIDAQCNHEVVVNMNADGIVVKGLTMRGGTEYTVSAVGRTSGTIRNNKVVSTCEGTEYGVNVYGSGSILVAGNEGTGFDDAAIYIGGIGSTPQGALRVKGNNTHDSQRGIIIEDSTGVNIKVMQNHIHDNFATGILINNSDDILVKGNTVTNNVTDGIHLVTGSDNNPVINNTFTGHTTDINNEGTGNCFSGNTYSTSSGPIDPCL